MYTSPQLLPDHAVYLTVTPNQALQLAATDRKADGVWVNPESPASSGFIASDRLEAVSEQLEPRQPLRRSISLRTR